MNTDEKRWTKMNKWKDRKTSRHKDTNTQRGKDKKTKRFFWSTSSQVPLASQGQDKTGKSTIYIVRRGNSVGWWWWQGRRLASGPITVTAVIQTLFHSPTTLLLPNCTQLDETALQQGCRIQTVVQDHLFANCLTWSLLVFAIRWIGFNFSWKVVLPD